MGRPLLSLGVDPNRLVQETVNRVQPVQADPLTPALIKEQAVDALSEQQSTWRSAEITREVARAVPTTTSSTAADVVAWVGEMSAAVENDLIVDLSLPVPSGAPLRRDGRPVTEPAVNRVLTTAAILAQENEIITRAQLRIDRGGDDRGMQRSGLAGVQHEVAAAVAGTRHLVLVVGPAGTGKTTALRPAVTQLRRDGRPVFGVTPSATAADVLATETGVDADTLDKLLIEHRLDRPPDPRYALPA